MKGSPGMACIKKKVPVTTHQRERRRIKIFFRRNGIIFETK
jgi:hypothetical protein